MLTETEKRVNQQVIALKDELVDLLSQLVSINTADPPGDNYEQIVHFLITYLEEIATYAEIVQASSESLTKQAEKSLSRPIVLAKIIGLRGKPILHFNGHYDVGIVLNPQVLNGLYDRTDTIIQVIAHTEPDSGVLLIFNGFSRLSHLKVIFLDFRHLLIFFAGFVQAFTPLVHRPVRDLKIEWLTVPGLLLHEID